MRSLIFGMLLAVVPNEASAKLDQQRAVGLDNYTYPIEMLVCVTLQSAAIAQRQLYDLDPEAREQYFNFLDWHHMCRREVVNSTWFFVRACRAKVKKKECGIATITYPNNLQWYGIFLPE